MTRFKISKRQIIESLTASGQNFEFDPQSNRTKLLLSIKRRHLSAHDKDLLSVDHKQPVFNYKLAFGLAAFLLFLGTGATFAIADTAAAGDKLFAIDKLQEKILLALPLNTEEKAQIRINIVKERAKELKHIKSLPNNEPRKAKAVEASEESLINAINVINERRQQFIDKGKTVEKLDSALSQLGELADEHEMEVDEIRAKVEDEQIRIELKLKLEEIRKAKSKTQIRHREDREDDRTESDSD